ncbi:MAG: hypothetical protein WA532_09645 [Candidatus Korobacteraceae bacterium]
MFLRRTIPAFVAISLALALAGCAKGPEVESITITPGTGLTSVPAGQTAQYTASAVLKQSTHPAFTRDVTAEVVWETGAPGIASTPSVTTVNGAPVAVSTAVSAGTATISASYGGITGTSDITVTSATGAGGGAGGVRDLVSVAVDPGTQSLSIPGQTAQFIAIGTFSSTPISVDLTNSAAWVSSDPTDVSINASGLATVNAAAATDCVPNCKVTITATGTDQSGDQIAGEATLTVTPSAVTSSSRALTSLAIIPSAQTLNTLGQTAQFIAIGTYNGSPTTQDLTTSATWSSSDTAVATVGTAGTTPATIPGQAIAKGCGASTCVTTITAEVTDPISGQIVGSAALTVSPGTQSPPATLTNITIIPGTGTQTLYTLGQTAQFIAYGTYNNGATNEVTDSVTWASSATGVATIAPIGGLATALSCNSPVFPPACTTIITATCSANSFSCGCAPNQTCTQSPGVVGTSNLTVEPGAVNPVNPNNLPSLTAYTVGAGAGTVASTAPSAAVDCVSGSAANCTAYFTSGSVVTLSATPSGGSTFGGFSSNCTPVTATTCTVTMDGNQTVGAIFN